MSNAELIAEALRDEARSLTALNPEALDFHLAAALERIADRIEIGAKK